MSLIQQQIITTCFIVALCSSTLSAKQLFAGNTIAINGVNSFQQPSLIGLVVRDELIPFEITDSTGIVILSGILEDKVVKSSDVGTHIFQSRIRELNSAHAAQINTISFSGYSQVMTEADVLLNGIGDTAPTRVRRTTNPGDQITFQYDVALIPPQESSFTTIATNATAFTISGQAVISVQIRQQRYTTTVITAAPSAPRTNIFPQQGLWWNPQRSGHGIDIEVIGGDSLFVIWYTYRDDNTPIWYLGSAAFSGNAWGGSMDVFSWDGQQATSQSTGQFGLDFSDTSHATFWWQFSGQERQHEPFELFTFATKKTAVDYSGTYFEQAKPGYGMTLSIQGDTELAVLYFYDNNGRATWAIGSNNHCTDDNYQLSSLQGFCPTCPAITPTSQSIGTIRPEMYSFSSGVLNADVTLNLPLSGNWKVDLARISNLSFRF
jgi:hypothetical protein